MATTPDRPLAKVWPWVGAALLVAAPLNVLLWPGAPQTGLDAIGTWTYAAKLAIEGTALLWAATRAALPARLRRSLRVMGGASLFSFLALVFTVVLQAGGPWNEALNQVTFLASYVLGLTALLLYPRVPLRRGQGRSLVLDVAVSVGTMGVLSWVYGGGAEIWARGDRWELTVAVAPLCLIAGLNVAVVAGQAAPTRRAFWWLIGGQAAYLPSLYIRLGAENHPALAVAHALAYFWGGIPTLVGAWLLGTDAFDPAAPPRGGSPRWMLHLNPVALASPLVLGVFLLDAVARDAHPELALITWTLLAVMLALVLRLSLTSAENARLHREEAEAAGRLQAAKLQGIARLAAGIAHEFNNLMATVVSTASSGAEEAPPGSTVREDFGTIGLAGQRAAALTRQLVRFSGGHPDRRLPIDVAGHAARLGPRLREEVGPKVEVELRLEPVPPAPVDPDQLEVLLVQLARNAAQAMPDGGTVRVSVRAEHLEAPRPSPVLSAGRGDHVVVEVEDTGPGIAPEVLPHVFEPFFSTREIFEAKGLGLAEVHGIVAAHAGGLSVESAPGKGARFTVLFPARRA